MPEISVIVPVYNTDAKKLRKCIESIQNQTFQNFEIVIVDDGSEKDTAILCDEIAKKDSRISVVHQENKGLPLARKAGVKQADGKYIMFVDSDDYVDKEMLADLYRIAKETECDVVCSQLRYIRETWKKKERRNKKEVTLLKNKIEMIKEMVVTRAFSASACGKLIKHTVLDKVTFPERIAIGEEHDMALKLVDLSNTVVVFDASYYNYVTNFSGISHSGYNEKYHNALDNYIKNKENTAKKYSVLESEINAFFSEFEMGVITAMCRNSNYDWEVIKKLQNVLRKDLKDILKNKTTKIFLKVSALFIVYVPRIFIIIYETIYNLLITGFGKSSVKFNGGVVNYNVKLIIHNLQFSSYHSSHFPFYNSKIPSCPIGNYKLLREVVA